MSVEDVYRRVLETRPVLSRNESRQLMRGILSGELSELRLAAVLGALAAQPEQPENLAGFVDALHEAAIPVPLTPEERDLLVDTCGTGADSSGTFNISTAAGLVAAAASATAGGFMVAKHGNRAVTSACGSADVLQALGIPVDLDPAAAAEALRAHRFAFLLAPALHPAMKIALPVRRALGVRTIFNLLGPLANPAGARAQVMGVYSERLVRVVAETMVLLGVRHAFVVHGQADQAAAGSTGMDELSISGPSQLAEVRDGRVTLHHLAPEDLGLERAPVASLRGGDAQDNASILRAIYSGEHGPHRNVVLLNSAAALVAAGAATGNDLPAALRDGVERAAEAIDSGAVIRLLETLAQR